VCLWLKHIFKSEKLGFKNSPKFFLFFWHFSGILSWQSGILGSKIVGNAALYTNDENLEVSAAAAAAVSNNIFQISVPNRPPFLQRLVYFSINFNYLLLVVRKLRSEIFKMRSAKTGFRV
jgi:hypothetical protein